MLSPIIDSTIQASILAATSCLIGQAITAYRSNVCGLRYTSYRTLLTLRQVLFSVDVRPVVQFIVYTILNCPPNYIWQTYLEGTFPSTRLVPSKSAISAASQNNEKELDREQDSNEILESKLHIPNTIAKFALDQTVGAAINTLFFCFVFATFRGASFEQAVQASKEEFWSLMVAGWKLWPMVSAVNFTVVRSVQTRNLVGSFAGMIWTVYLSLVAGSTER
jgi:protein Mpv17